MLNPIEEAKFAELKDKCRELKVPAPPEIFIGLQVHDRSGVLVFDDIQRGHSWTRNFWNLMYGLLAYGMANGTATFSAGYMSGRNYGGTIRAMNNYASAIDQARVSAGYGHGFLENAATGTFGIFVGTGDTAFSPEHYAMATKIVPGNGANQLYYNSMIYPTVAYTAGTKTWKSTFLRIFNNNSGSSITVKETGLVSNIYLGSYYNEAYLTERSVLDPTVAVANGAQLTVTYEISMDFSAID